MKTRLLIICIIVLSSIILIPQTFAENEPTIAKLEWSQANYKVTNGTGAVKVIVTDPDRNALPNNIDILKVFVYSDSDREGNTLTLYETEKNTGIFERTFTFSDKRSAPSVLYARDGDTVTAQYVDGILPMDADSKNITLNATMFLGSTGPPLERAPAELLRVEDLQGNVVEKIPTILVDQQVKIVADIKNQMDREQDFAYLVQILDENKAVMSLSWLTGSLTPMQTFSSAQSWTPQDPGKYSATVFVWESINNPTALSPPLETQIIVKEHEFVSANEPRGDFTLTVSNQSFEISSVDITVKIDGKKVIDDDFKVGNQHNFHHFEFELAIGSHTLYVGSDIANVELEEQFEVDEQTWGYLSYIHDENHAPRFGFETSDEAFGFV